MPRKAAGARLHQRKTGIFYIRDTGRNDISTGTRDRREAEVRLAGYIAARGRRPGGPATPDQMTISEVLAIYGEHHAAHVSDPVRISYAIDALDRHLGGLPVSAISGAVCRRYAADRRKRGRRDPETGEVSAVLVAPGTARRELGTLQAACVYSVKNGYLTSAPGVTLPEKPPAKERWLTRSEVARLVWAAWRNPKSKHLARFILVAIHTGTRRSAILRLQFHANTAGGWVDLEADPPLLYRRGEGQRETKKRQTVARIPSSLVPHLRRWAARGDRYVVSEDGSRIDSIRTAWARACRVAGLKGATPHTLRHSSITWVMQGGGEKWEVAGFFGVSMETIERVYGHHHPSYQDSVLEAMKRRR